VTPQRRQQLLLGVLLALAVVWGLSALTGDGAVEGTASGPRAPERRGRGTAAGRTVELAELRVDDLEQAPGILTPGRDPFRFGEPPKPPGPTPEELAARRAAEEAALRAAEEAARRAAEQAAAEPPRPQPPPVTFTYLGSFGRPDRRIAVLAAGENIINARRGDVIDGKFILADIGYESVDIGFVAFPEAPPKRLRIGGDS
jgi:hypothetical protein